MKVIKKGEERLSEKNQVCCPAFAFPYNGYDEEE